VALLTDAGERTSSCEFTPEMEVSLRQENVPAKLLSATVALPRAPEPSVFVAVTVCIPAARPPGNKVNPFGEADPSVLVTAAPSTDHVTVLFVVFAPLAVSNRLWLGVTLESGGETATVVVPFAIVTADIPGEPAEPGSVAMTVALGEAGRRFGAV